MKYGKFITDINHENNETTFITQEEFNQSLNQKLFLEYFDNPMMTKINDEGNSSHYYAKINTSLLSEGRYIILIVNKDNENIGKRISMNNLNWVSLQTRSLRNDQNVLAFNYKKGILFSNVILSITKKTESYTQYYNSDMKLYVYVFHTKNNLSYPDNVSLQSAIEMYQTIIN